MPQESLIVTQAPNRRLKCVREGDPETCVVGLGSSVEEAVGSWVIYSHVVEIKSYPPSYPDLRECYDCQKPITEKADTTEKKFWCATCRDRRDAESKRQCMADERAEQLFPEMLESKAAPAKYKIIGQRLDLSLMAEERGRYAVSSVYDNEGVAWIWVFDDESETVTKKQVRQIPKDMHNSCYFYMEVYALISCIIELNRKGHEDATKPSPREEEETRTKTQADRRRTARP